MKAFEQPLISLLGAGDRLDSRRRDREVPFRPASSLGSGLADTRPDEALFLEPIQRGIQRAGRYGASCVFGDLAADRHTVRLVVEPENREQNELLEFAEIDRSGHMSCIVVKYGPLSRAAVDAAVDVVTNHLQTRFSPCVRECEVLRDTTSGVKSLCWTILRTA